MASKKKVKELRGNMAMSDIRALEVLADGGQAPGRYKGSQLSGALAPAPAVRKLEGYGCVRVMAEYPKGRGHQLDVKVTALGKQVARQS
jgi:hypothetical protein